MVYKAKLFRALTLIEVSIVIGILAILSGVIIVTLKPKEQTGKASDGTKKTDSAALLSAVNRYFVSYNGVYPWASVSNCSAPSSNGTSTVSSCWLNRLVSVGEVDSSFANGSNISSFIVTLDASSVVHICFVPASQAFLSQAYQNSSGASATPGTHICVPE
ncbi:hypothetical protein A2713_01560 [candidate division WWE3 bacterium RIFCSPHIGHO2_01_FULL_35_17]|uniref:Type II secretion system protein GspG C-terminal domain-containing protein n=1 Tax=candidate division WWE3 bacterium RIFCSPHIGHO2_01_FULL_35_17 TaxID=1802614 RepID=A0A1F4URT2_UNCKA|nr:MAG: hypothetical protein A2713_01560 [candidate division WWE3 bacterium RIFCSPHIGHO2_01_FULL_35_17]